MTKKKRKKHLPKGLPEKFVARLSDIYGESVVREVKKTFVARPTTFRVNTIKATKEEIVEVLKRENFKTDPVPWYKDAFILKNKTKRDLTKLDIYEDGKIYIQSLASMAPPMVMDLKPGDTVLDLTAAPGSKTSQIAALMGKKGGLVANDVNKVRFFRLKANMENLGVTNTSFRAERSEVEGSRGTVEISPLSASRRIGRDDVQEKGWEFTLRLEDGSALCKEYEGPYFDKILVDAICSGESRFIDGDPKTYGYWSEHKIKQIAYRQHKLLMGAWQVLKPGGILVYSTCTIAPEENESRISKMLERCEDLEVVDVKIKGLKRAKPVMEWKDRVFDKRVKKTFRMMPTHLVEGFFIAKLRKKT